MLVLTILAIALTLLPALAVLTWDGRIDLGFSADANDLPDGEPLMPSYADAFRCGDAEGV